MKIIKPILDVSNEKMKIITTPQQCAQQQYVTDQK